MDQINEETTVAEGQGDEFHEIGEMRRHLMALRLEVDTSIADAISAQFEKVATAFVQSVGRENAPLRTKLTEAHVLLSRQEKANAVLQSEVASLADRIAQLQARAQVLEKEKNTPIPTPTTAVTVEPPRLIDLVTVVTMQARKRFPTALIDYEVSTIGKVMLLRLYHNRLALLPDGAGDPNVTWACNIELTSRWKNLSTGATEVQLRELQELANDYINQVKQAVALGLVPPLARSMVQNQGVAEPVGPLDQEMINDLLAGKEP